MLEQPKPELIVRMETAVIVGTAKTCANYAYGDLFNCWNSQKTCPNRAQGDCLNCWNSQNLRESCSGRLPRLLEQPKPARIVLRETSSIVGAAKTCANRAQGDCINCWNSQNPRELCLGRLPQLLEQPKHARIVLRETSSIVGKAKTCMNRAYGDCRNCWNSQNLRESCLGRRPQLLEQPKPAQIVLRETSSIVGTAKTARIVFRETSSIVGTAKTCANRA